MSRELDSAEAGASPGDDVRAVDVLVVRPDATWQRLVRRLEGRKVPRFARRWKRIWERVGLENPFEPGGPSPSPIGLGSMALGITERRQPAPHLNVGKGLTSPKLGGSSSSKHSSNPYRKTDKRAEVMRASATGTITVTEVKRGQSAASAAASASRPEAPPVEIPKGNAAVPLRHRVIPAPRSSSGRIRFKHPKKQG